MGSTSLFLNAPCPACRSVTLGSWVLKHFRHDSWFMWIDGINGIGFGIGRDDSIIYKG